MALYYKIRASPHGGQMGLNRSRTQWAFADVECIASYNEELHPQRGYGSFRGNCCLQVDGDLKPLTGLTFARG